MNPGDIKILNTNITNVWIQVILRYFPRIHGIGHYLMTWMRTYWKRIHWFWGQTVQVIFFSLNFALLPHHYSIQISITFSHTCTVVMLHICRPRPEKDPFDFWVKRSKVKTLEGFLYCCWGVRTTLVFTKHVVSYGIQKYCIAPQSEWVRLVV